MCGGADEDVPEIDESLIFINSPPENPLPLGDGMNGR